MDEATTEQAPDPSNHDLMYEEMRLAFLEMKSQFDTLDSRFDTSNAENARRLLIALSQARRTLTSEILATQSLLNDNFPQAVDASRARSHEIPAWLQDFATNVLPGLLPLVNQWLQVQTGKPWYKRVFAALAK